MPSLERPRVDPRRLAFGLVAAGLVAFVATRAFHPIRGLGNPDIGGILYSADTLGAGLLPYRDTVDLKQPGAFFLVAAVFAISRSLDALAVAFGAWLLLGAPAVWIAARAIHPAAEPAKHLGPAIATALYLLTVGAFDMNYSAWMTPPYAWSFACFCHGLATKRRRAYVLAGVFFSVAYLFKAQAIVLVPLFVGCFFWARRRGWSGATWSAWPAWVGGAALGVLPLVALYAARGALPALLHGMFPMEEALGYSVKRAPWSTQLEVLWKVPRQQIRAFFLMLSLGLAAVIETLRRRRGDDTVSTRPSLVPALAFYLASLLGCGLGGGRFYQHYLAQCVPALALVAAHPSALDWLGAARSTTARGFVRWSSRLHALVLAALLLFSIGRVPFGKNLIADNLGSSSVEQAGAFVRERSRPDDTLLVWGWQGWGTYYFAQRRSPSPVFKVLGEVTEFNDNTAFSKGTEIHFKPGPLADRLLEDVRARPPAFIIRSNPFFPGSPHDPLDDWPEMKQLVQRRYRVVKRFRFLVVYERKQPRPAP